MASRARKERRRLARLEREARDRDQHLLDPEFDDDDVLAQPTAETVELAHTRASYIPHMHRDDPKLSESDRIGPNRTEQLTALADQVERDLAEALPEPEPEPPTLVEVVRVERPPMVERVEREGPSYEEANWPKLSPAFRTAHNRLRALRGLPPIPPPAIDLYRPPLVRKVDPKELEALNSEATTAKAQFLGQQRHMAPGREGFTINGEPLKF